RALPPPVEARKPHALRRRQRRRDEWRGDVLVRHREPTRPLDGHEADEEDEPRQSNDCDIA
ncbi:MAG: hypothetical protein QOC59_678, partial [Microbacteriaceae bacterium]|nr:hypothetical protein [Microbacteriaceae bacterium]